MRGQTLVSQCDVGRQGGAGGPPAFCSWTRDGSTATYDANGNVSEYIDAVSGNAAAHYEYDAFGNQTKQAGDNPDAFPHRFSTKYLDEEVSLYYYGRRFYSPELGRWLSRDPIGERGGLNLHAFVSNRCVGTIDRLGKSPLSSDGAVDPCSISGMREGKGRSGGIVCHKGAKYVCLWGYDTPGLPLGIKRCAREHEESHLDDDADCDPCRTHRLCFRDLDQKAKRESELMEKQLACLKRAHKGDCQSEYDPDKSIPDMTPCEMAYWREITHIEYSITQLPRKAVLPPNKQK